MKPNLRIAGLLLFIVTCEVSSTGFAPTGAKGRTNEYGELVYVDEECGGLDDLGYAGVFQNAMFRDGAVLHDRLYTVDGSHLWVANLQAYAGAPSASGIGTPTLQLLMPFVGHANAVTAGEGFLAVALVDRTVMVLPDGNAEEAIFLHNVGRSMDVAASGSLLAIGSGNQGVQVYDLASTRNPLLLFSSEVTGYVAGVEWEKHSESRVLNYAACSRVGRFDFAKGFGHPVHLSAELSHHNGKDIAAVNKHVFVANNGQGLWFLDSKLEVRRKQDSSDPNFYANAVAADDSEVYLAAGNRQLSAYGFDGSERALINKDPIGVLVFAQLVYGFGNFREIGERTITRAPSIQGSGIDAFQSGFSRIVEPFYLQPATYKAPSGEIGYRVSLFWQGEHRVYERLATDTSWRLLAGYAFYGNAGHYRVEVKRDNMLEIYSPLSIFGPDFSTQLQVDLASSPERWVGFRTFENGVLVDYGGYAQLYQAKTEWAEVEVDSGYAAEHPVSVHYLGYPAVEQSSFHAELNRWREQLGRETEPVKQLMVNARQVNEKDVYWISRMFDAPVSTTVHQEVLEFQGSSVIGCEGCKGLERYGGVLDVLPLTQGAVVMIDDRRASTTLLVFLDGTGKESSRWLHLGRPSGLMPDGAFVRVWFADGSSFRFDPSGEHARLDEFEPIIR